MREELKNEAEEKSDFDYWTTLVGSFWSLPGDSAGASDKGQGGKEKKESDSAKDGFGSFFSAFGEPGAFFREMDDLPRAADQMGRKMGEYFADLHKSGLETLIRCTGGPEQEGPFTDDGKMIARFAEIYKKEFRRYLEVPQLGLNRFRQERMNRFIDRQNLLQATLAEFLHLFCVPVERAAEVMRKRVEEKFKAGEKIEDAKAFHTLWIRILEEQYMEQLKSSEYTELLGRTLDATVQFRSAREEVLYDLMEELPVPTNRDMDELYREIRNLKKRVKKMSAAFETSRTEM